MYSLKRQVSRAMTAKFRLVAIGVLYYFIFVCTLLPYMRSRYNQQRDGSLSVTVPKYANSKPEGNPGTFLHPVCKCPITFPSPVSQNILPPTSEMTCSEFASRRGYNQKVVVYILYRGHDKYRHGRDYAGGIKENLRTVEKEYGSDWTLRIYYSVPEDSTEMIVLCKVVCSTDRLDICDASKVPKFKNGSALNPTMWRLFPLFDPQVDIVLSRDLDSYILPRESAAVKTFLDSDMSFHIIRDHPKHKAPILGGTWGAKVYIKSTRELLWSAFKMMLDFDKSYMTRMERGIDQHVFRHMLWEKVQSIRMIHDSYHCEKNPNETFPFTVQRTDDGVSQNFVGANSFIGRLPFDREDSKCPIACRPKNHQDWEFC